MIPFSSLAGRLAALDQKLEPEDRQRIADVTRGPGLRQIAGELLNAIDPDVIQAKAEEEHGPEPTEEQKQATATRLKDKACRPFDDPALRTLLVEIKQKSEIVIDDISVDVVISQGYDQRQAEDKVKSFRDFIEENKDRLTALEIIYSQPRPKQRLTYDSIRELRDRLADPPHHLTTAHVWLAYKRLQAGKVRGAPADDTPDRRDLSGPFCPGPGRDLGALQRQGGAAVQPLDRTAEESGQGVQPGADELAEADKGLPDRQPGDRPPVT